jgi:hypothetical protein
MVLSVLFSWRVVELWGGVVVIKWTNKPDKLMKFFQVQK